MSGDKFNRQDAKQVLGTAASPVTLAASYTVEDSGVVIIGKASEVILLVNYTMGASETANSIDLQYAVADGTTPSITGGTIAFVDSASDTITDSGGGFLTNGLSPGQVLQVKGSGSNDGFFTAETVVAGTITLISTDELTDETAAKNVTIEANSGPFYLLQNESESSGTTTRYNRGDLFTAASAAGAYDRFAIKFSSLGSAEFLRVYVKETGTSSNFGNTWIEAITLGQ